MFDTPDYEQSDSNTLSKKHKHRNIERLDVYVYSFDQSLNLDTDESYTLTVSPTRHLTSFTCGVTVACTYIAWHGLTIPRMQTAPHANSHVHATRTDSFEDISQQRMPCRWKLLSQFCSATQCMGRSEAWKPYRSSLTGFQLTVRLTHTWSQPQECSRTPSMLTSLPCKHLNR